MQLETGKTIELRQSNYSYVFRPRVWFRAVQVVIVLGLVGLMYQYYPFDVWMDGRWKLLIPQAFVLMVLSPALVALFLWASAISVWYPVILVTGAGCFRSGKFGRIKFLARHEITRLDFSVKRVAFFAGSLEFTAMSLARFTMTKYPNKDLPDRFSG
ncbi:MAG: hypothetical protein JKY60_04410 [Kordiimonadaceae bacterium]|nr:hypothetical protein [Kordiimonadaceae bacterium]